MPLVKPGQPTLAKSLPGIISTKVAITLVVNPDFTVRIPGSYIHVKIRG
jgi:hypothetical protein